MGRVESISAEGLILFFHSSDHWPPHFHARKPGHWEIRVDIKDTTEETLSFDLKWPRQAVLPAKVLRSLGILVAGNRAALLQEWLAKVDQTKKGEE